jgi:DNA-binding FrmR family transcriptional regulator
MSTAELITYITNVAVIIFLVWSYFRRRNIDNRIDRLAGVLSAVTDLLDKNRSWEKTANEIKAIEEAYERKVKAEIDAHKNESLQSAANIKKSEIQACYELECMENSVKLFIPSDLKSLIYAQMLKQGFSKSERHVAAFFTSDKEVNDAFLILAKAEESANK